MKWVLVDLSYLAYRARFSMKGLAHEEIPTGVLFGVFDQLKSICEDLVVYSNKLAIFCDSKKSYRKDKYPFYKGKRHLNMTEEEVQDLKLMHQQIDLLKKEIFPEIGIPVYLQTGLESDDLIAKAAQDLTKKQQGGIIVSSDGDLFQCITHMVTWYNPQKELHYTISTFAGEKGIEPHKWGKVKAIAGCSTDDVPGVKGVGEKTAILYLQGKLDAKYKAYQSIRESKDIIKRNKEIVCLPHQETQSIELVSPSFDQKAFFRFCKKYGMASFLKNKKEWEAFFQGPAYTNIRTRRRNGTRG